MGTSYDIFCSHCGTLRSMVNCGRGMHYDPDALETNIMVCPLCENLEIVTKKAGDWSIPKCRRCGEVLEDAERKPYGLKCPYCEQHTVHLEFGMLFD